MKTIFLFYQISFLIILPASNLAHIGKVTVLENFDTNQQVILYGDLHSSDSPDVPEDVQMEQIDDVLPKIEKALELKNTKVLFEGLEPVEKREKNITPNGFFLLHLTKLYDKLISSESSANIINIDNRDFIFNETYNYLLLKECLKHAEEDNDETAKLQCFNELKDEAYDPFRPVEHADLYNNLS